MNLNIDAEFSAQLWLVEHGYQESALVKMDDAAVLELYYKEKHRHELAKEALNGRLN